MEQLVGADRNDPCPSGELDVARLVDEAIELEDWSPLDPLVDRAMELFAKGGPLEHVRLRDDRVLPLKSDTAELAKHCPAGWLQRCELELARVLDGHALEADERVALRMTAHLVRR